MPQIPLSLETLKIIAPYALAVAFVGLLESLMTAKLVDDVTDTRSNKTREAWGQGVANLVTGFFGGMGGCAMIGQSMVNVKGSGARTRISTFLAGVFLLVLVVVFGDVVSLIPMAALVAVMIFVSVATFDWHGIRPSKLAPHAQERNRGHGHHRAGDGLLAQPGDRRGTGRALSDGALRAARRPLRHGSERLDPSGDTVTYTIHGELFFASSNDLYTQFEYALDPANVVIDMTESHLWDVSTIAALEAITDKYASRGKTVHITGMNEASAAMHERMAGHLG